MKRKATQVAKNDVFDAYQLFYDVVRSQKFIEESSQPYMFDTANSTSNGVQMDLS